jgi:phospho-N-acetylmuramoyl-pentapeptide-transferase
LQRLQIGEEIRDLGLEGQMAKKGTPTMGGFIILLSLLIPTLLFSKITNVYIVLLVTSAIWLGAVGFTDDYIKVFKKNKDGLSGKFKIIGQIGLGIIVGLTMYFNQHIKVREFATDGTFVDHKSLVTTVPFMKDNQFDYNMLLPSFIPDEYVWIVYVLVVIFIITAVSNGANITDGIDGLAAGTSVIIGIALAILAYVSGNKVISQYLNVMFIPNSGELAVFCAAFVGACIGFLWYNAYPAQVFMGDTGSLMLGGVIATLAIVIRKEMLIPVLCGIFLIENLSVIIQVAYFKYTKRKYGEGRRVFLMSPLHHHFQMKNYHESKIVIRFLIVGIILAVLSLVTLKLR